ncbi:MAG: protein kinase, partial [Planctomycetes bacterium]|nr:protein kinase [Planctomycetota bacterium]
MSKQSPDFESWSLSLVHRVNAACERFRDAWKAGHRPKIEEFLAQVADEERAAHLRELLALELEHRSKSGETPRQEEYHSRFPGDTELIRKVFSDAAAHGSGAQPQPGSPEVKTDDYKTASPEVESERPAEDSGAAQNAGSSAGGSSEAESEAPCPDHIGRYPVRRRLGRGGFGNVYLAHHFKLDVPVAIKVPSEELQSSHDARANFLQEARNVARLRHDDIVRVFEVADEPHQPCFIVYEYIEGMSLEQRIEQGRMPPRDVALLVARVADALHYAHQQGLIHRDIKPANVLLNEHGEPRLADFGLAVWDEQWTQWLKTRAGSPAYMSPEQVAREGHLIDRRTGVYSLGVVLYELLCGRRPFAGQSPKDVKGLFEAIKRGRPQSPRLIDSSVPAELERVCLKAISRRITDRYRNAAEMAEDLRLALATPGRDKPGFSEKPGLLDEASGDRGPRVVPKGLRSFGPEDSDFFLELLPGQRDREGLPESIRFWKTRIEAKDSDQTFPVGLLYGPSGCGKSSLLKAGLLPRLDASVRQVYLEATRDQTESQLAQRLAKACPWLDPASPLPQMIAGVHRGGGVPSGQKVLIVVDQFEQWLHAHGREMEQTDMVAALRQADGQHVQFLLTVRDDFWPAVSRLSDALEILFVNGQNQQFVDLFDLRHARQVLELFGRAYQCLPQRTSEVSAEQNSFLDSAVDGLSEDGKVISVRLSLFADMLKARPWTPQSLVAVGGTSGVGVTFLEETFSARSASPEHRVLEQPARAVLTALLPESGSEIKGGRRPQEELLKAAELQHQPQRFARLLDVLDRELRIITPVDDPLECGDLSPLSSGELPPSPSAALSAAGDMHCDDRPVEEPEKRRQVAALQSFQLTHDYLVPPLRDWLTRKKRETWRGRAQLRLEERTAQWLRTRASRFLPNPLEYASIVAGVRRRKRTPDQQRLLRAASGRYGVIAVLVLIAAGVLCWAGWEANGGLRADGLVQAVRNASIDQVLALATQLQPYNRWAHAGLVRMRADDSDPDAQLHAALALLCVDATQAAYLTERLLASRIEQLPVVRDMLGKHAGSELELVRAKLWVTLRDGNADKSRRFNAALALATFESDGPGWSAETVNFVVGQLLASSVDFQARYRAALQPVRLRLVDAVRAAAADAARDATQRILAANALVDFGRDQPEALARALVVANERQYAILLAAVRPHRDQALAELERQLVARPQRMWPNDVDVTRFAEPARATVLKIDHAHGLVEPHFAFCQSLPLAEFAELSETLRANGYRPTRLRPCGRPDPLVCAVVWQRDGRDWQFRTGLAADAIATTDAEMAAKGLDPVDVTGYLDGNEPRYAVLWGAPDAPIGDEHSSPQREQGTSLARRASVPRERSTLEVGLTRQEFETKAKGDLAPVVLQLTNPPGNAPPRLAVIWRRKRSADDSWAIGGETTLTQNAAS